MAVVENILLDSVLRVMEKPREGFHSNVIAASELTELVSLKCNAELVVESWIQVMNADSENTWASPSARIYILVAVLRAFESLLKSDYYSLHNALTNRTTLRGSPLSVIGTRCELNGRTAEALYLEGRRDPAQQMCFSMLIAAKDLLSFNLTECRQKDNPKIAQRWYGMRGVCSLMEANVSKDLVEAAKSNLYLNAANDLEKAFHLGNRGSSSATFLLDVLLHVYDIDNSRDTLIRIRSIIDLLRQDEKRNRCVLFEIGRYYFYESFYDVDQPNHFFSLALSKLSESLEYPQELSVDDAIVRLIRGQVYVRLAMSLEERSEAWLDAISNGIADLQFAFESAPQKFGKQSSLISALESRSDHFVRSGQYDLARKDLEYSKHRPEMVSANPQLGSQAEVKLILVSLREANESFNYSAIEEMLPQVMEHSEFHIVGTLTAAIAAKRLFEEKSTSDNPALLVRLIDLISNSPVEMPKDTDAQRMHLSALAGLQYILGRKWGNLSSLEDAVGNFEKAIKAADSPPPTELLSFYGNCCLHLAKVYLTHDNDSDTTVELLEEAARNLYEATQNALSSPDIVDDSFRMDVGFSKVGEANLRLSTLTGGEKELNVAITSLLKSQELGNNTSELFGLLGDAYYRRYKKNRSNDDLQNALSYKSQARESGGVSRENYSLSARLELFEWERSGRIGNVSEAILLAAKAHGVSPSWPWPPFQIAEIIEHVGVTNFRQAFLQAKDTSPNLKLIDIDIENCERSLIHLGCSLVIQNEEFAQQKFSTGRQKVYVLEDSHQLLSESYVFKETSNSAATRDRGVISAFSAFIREHGIRGLGLPRPIAVIPQTDNNVVYVMRRAKGHHIGREVIRANREETDAPVMLFRRAAEYLAAYHAWGASVSHSPNVNLMKFVESDMNRTLSIPRSNLSEKTKSLLADFGELPQLLKKDAHPENWLVDDFGKIYMIDFESSIPLPALFEVSQLIEDYPLLDANAKGWDRRKALFLHYIDRLEEFSSKQMVVSDDHWELLYAVFAILRVGFGIPYCRGKLREATSSSTLNATVERETHYTKLINWFSFGFPDEGINDFAKVFMARLGIS